MSTHGGLRPGAGRPKGAKNKKPTKEIAALRAQLAAVDRDRMREKATNCDLRADIARLEATVAEGEKQLASAQREEAEWHRVAIQQAADLISRALRTTDPEHGMYDIDLNAILARIRAARGTR